jgi:5-methylthioadenosine/S-adenosylhomocysteine deaminase
LYLGCKDFAKRGGQGGDRYRSSPTTVETTSMTAKLIRGGYVLSLDPVLGDLPVGDVLIEGETIAAVAPSIDAPHAELVDAAGTVVMPGLIDTHRHVWQGAFGGSGGDWTLPDYATTVFGGLSPRFTPEDVRDGTFYGALEALDAGITTMFDWAHIVNTPEHADAAVDALKASGLRAVFGYGTPTNDPAWAFDSELTHPADARRIAGEQFSSPGDLVTLALALRGPESTPPRTATADLALARELGVRASMHIGVGTYGAARGVTQLHERGQLGEDLIFLHANTCTDDELKMIAGSGGSVSVSARVEMMMGHGYPVTGRALDAGLHPSLSVDVTSAVPGDLFDELRGVLMAERARRSDEQLARGEQPSAVALTARQAIEMATVHGAETLGMTDRVGTLTPGKRADLILLDAGRHGDLRLRNDVPTLVLHSSPADVLTVLVDGGFRKRDGRLTGVDARAARQRAEASRDRLTAA